MNSKNDNFIRIAENRTNKIVDMISKLHNLTNTSFYEYTEEDIEKMFNRIEKELAKQKEYFRKEAERKGKRIEL